MSKMKTRILKQMDQVDNAFETADLLYKLAATIDKGDRMRVLLEYGISFDEALVMRTKLPAMIRLINDTIITMYEDIDKEETI